MQTVVVNEIIIKRLSYNNEVIIFILGQNKNRYVVGYFLRRVATNRHQEISHPHAETRTCIQSVLWMQVLAVSKRCTG